MLNPRLAVRYAKALIDLAIERNELEAAYSDMQYLNSVSKSNKDFVMILKSPIISSDKKISIIEAVTNGKVSGLAASFIRLLVKKGRESNLPEIAQAFIEQYKQNKHIHTVTLTTALPVSEEMKKEIVDKVKSQSDMKNIELTTAVNEELIGGFILQIGDTLVDASIAYDLKVIKKQFLNNDFIYKIR